MRKRGPGDGVVQVELLEADAVLGLEPSPADDGDPVEAARARRLRWVGLAVVAMLLGTIVAAMVVDGRRQAARQAALAELGWVLPPIRGPLEEVWRAPGAWVIATTAQVVVVQDPTEGGVRALDAATGALLWERPGADWSEYCYPVHDYRSIDQDPYQADILVCGPAGSSEGLPDAGVTVAIVAVDTATGVEQRSLVIDGKVLAPEVADEDLVVTFVDAQAAIGVIRWDPHAGEVWSYRSAPGVLPEGTLWASPADGWVYGLEGDVLRLTTDLALDVNTGHEVQGATTNAGPNILGNVQRLPDGGWVEWLWDDSGQRWATRGRVLNPDGSLRFEVDGEPWSGGLLTDGSVPDAILTIGPTGEGAALEPSSGSELWSVPEMFGTRPAFLLEGTMVVVGSSTVTALDARDGTAKWQVGTGWATNATAPTDGDVALVQVRERPAGEDPGTFIVAVDLRTGTEAWRMPAVGSGGYWDLVHVGDRFLLLSDAEIIGLR